jgi:hypothetical protein
MFGAPWEHGSHYWLPPAPTGLAPSLPWPAPLAWYGSGRDVLRTLVRHEAERTGLKRLWVPTYFCQKALESLSHEAVDLHSYAAGPWCAPGSVDLPCQQGDGVIDANVIGLQAESCLSEATRARAIIIEDHTHDPCSPWALQSGAHWWFASLRKPLPLPDGAVLWSPRGLALPPAPPRSEVHEARTLRRFAAMALKSAYLQGCAIRKDDYLVLYRETEAQVGIGGPAAMCRWSRSLLEAMPLMEWRERRLQNHRALGEVLAGAEGLEVFAPWGTEDCCPFSVVVLLADRATRDRVYGWLVGHDVYPTVLWNFDAPTLPDFVAADDDGRARELAARMLSVQCDQRYDAAQMERVGGLILRACEECGVEL